MEEKPATIKIWKQGPQHLSAVKKEVMKHQFNDVASIEERVKAMTFTEFKKGKEVSGKARVLTKA